MKLPNEGQKVLFKTHGKNKVHYGRFQGRSVGVSDTDGTEYYEIEEIAAWIDASEAFEAHRLANPRASKPLDCINSGDYLDRLKNSVSQDDRNRLLNGSWVVPECNGDCGVNYCDENGCVERKRESVQLSPIEQIQRKYPKAKIILR